jgi:hypothetical protein
LRIHRTFGKLFISKTPHCFTRNSNKKIMNGMQAIQTCNSTSHSIKNKELQDKNNEWHVKIRNCRRDK